ncbi:MAG TPA: T9SS type A sorting domain-containing protein [Puia sp.]|nr:T9SS type A sorting domain-containing protein [Puia sp.]
MKRPLHRALRSALGGIFLLFLALQGQSQQILDLLSTSPTVAFSLRQLKSTATKAIQVRRSSDNAVMDIGFTAGGDLDQAALLAFVGGSDGYVTIWYDQTGNSHDALQATVAKQPRIVSAGTVMMQNGRPICDFNGTSSTMATANFPLTTPLSVFLVNRRTGTGTSTTGFVTMFDGTNNNTFKVAYPNTSSPTSMGLSPQDWNAGASLQPVPQLNSNALFMYSALCDGAGGVQYLNGGVQTHNFPGATNNLNGIRLFRGTPLPADNELPAGQLSEVIVFGSKIGNADRQLLECSQSTYYAIQIVPAGLEFYVTSGISPNGCAQAKEDVAWQAGSLNNVQATGSMLTKYGNGNWDGGAASWNKVSNNGYLEFTAGETNKARMVGLGNSFTSNSYTTIQYAWYLTNTGNLQIYESGSGKGSYGTYNTGDVLRIAVESGVVKYYKNGVLQYISSAAPTLPMLVDVSIYDKGGTVTGANVVNYSTGTFTATASNAGSSPGYQWYLNGSPVGTNTNTYTNTSLNAGDVVNCVLTADISGCSPVTIASNNVTEAITTAFNIDYYIQGAVSAAGCNSVIEQVDWNSGSLSTGMSASGNSLSKVQFNGWNGGAASYNTVSNNGYFQFTASETNKSRMAGLSNAYTSSSYTTIQYAWYVTNSGSLQVYESGTNRGTFGTYATGDILKISVESGTVKYYKNGVLQYISQTAPTLPLLVDVSINDAGGTINNALVSNYNAGVFTATATNTGVNPTYNWLVNGVSVQNGLSATYTNTSLNNGDVVSCVLTPNLVGCSSVPMTSNTITEAMIPPANVDFSINGVAATTNCSQVVEQVRWKVANTTSNAVVSGNNISKFQNVSGWDCGSYSWNTVSNNGYFQFTATETNKTRAVGLSSNYSVVDYTGIQFCFYLNSNGSLQIYESGSGRATVGTFATGDVLKIAVESGVVKYYQNGSLVYISNVAPTLPLGVDVALYNTGSTISNAVVGNYNAGSFIASTANAGGSPIFNWMVNGVSVQNSTSNTYTNGSLNSSDVVTCVMTPNLAGCSSVPVASNSITDTIVPPINVDFSIQGVAASSNCTAVIEQVKWNLSNLTTNMTVVSTNGLSKFQSSNWDGGAGSWNTVSNNGYLQFTATETNTARMVGLSTSYAGSNYTTIQYAWYLTSGGSLQIYESGSYRGSFGTYATGDVLKISVESGVVKYYKNEVLQYISGVAPTLPMIVDVSMYHPGATIANALVYNYNSGSFIANASNAGSSPTFNWFVNGVSVQNGTSNTYTNTSLANGDVVTCKLTPNLSGCVAASISSNTITDTVVSPLGMDFAIQGTPVTTNCSAVTEQVKWQLSTLNSNLTVTAPNGLSRFQNSGWNAGVASWNTVSNNGYFQFTATETNTYRAIGLSNTFTGNNYTNIQYCFYLNAGGALSIYESGSGRGNYGTYNTGDVLKIAVENNVVKYYKNGSLLYISSITPTLPMLVDATIYNTGGTITGATVTNYNAGTFTASAVNAGVNPTFNWFVNGVSVQNGASATYTNTSLTANDVVTCQMTPNLSGCTAIPVSSNTLTDTIADPANLDFSITGAAGATNCNSAVEQVKWKLSDLSPSLLVTSVNGLSKFQNGGWNSGASSWNTVSNNGYFQFTATETNKNRMAGLSTSYTGSSYTNIQYAFFLTSGGSLQIYESGNGRITVGSYTTGDILKISVENNVVKYYQNGTLVYISTVAPTLPMLVDAALNDVGATIGNALVSNYSSGVFTANTVNAGANPNFNWMVNGVSMQNSTSATYTNTGLHNGDVVTCVITPDLAGCSAATTYTSNSITDSVALPQNLDFSITGTAATTNCTSAVEQVKWKLSDLSTNLVITGANGLSKFTGGGWNTGASSWNTVSNNGYFQFTATETNKSRMAGLSTSYTGTSYTNIQFAFYLVAGGSLQIFESGNGRGSFGTYNTGDVLKISVENNQVKYYKNGTLLYISNLTPTLPLLVDAALNDVGSTIGGALVSNYNAGVFTANTVNAGANPTFNWMVNGVSMQNSTSATYTNTSLNNGDVVTCVLTPDLSGCNATTTYTSNKITDSVAAPVNLDFSIVGTASTSNCTSVIEQVKWKVSDLNNNLVVVGGNGVSRFQNSGWNAGASSWNTVSNNGYFQFTATETTTDRMVGLSTSFTGNSYTNIQYAIRLRSPGVVEIFESGNSRGAFGTYTTGDIMKITVESNVVKYYKNGTLLYVSTVAPVLPMLVDVSINSSGGSIGNALVSNYNAGVFTANTANAGTNPIFNWMVNGVSVQNGPSATYTNTSLNNGDVVTCVLTPDLAGCNTSTTYTSNTITNTTVPPLNVDFSITGTAASSNCASVIEQVKWKTSTVTPNMTVASVNSLSKFQSNGNWDAAAASWNTVSNNGYFVFTASENTTSRMAGLSATYTSASYTTIQYAFYLNTGGSLQIYESGSNKGTFGTYTSGDSLKISVESNVVKYYKNGTLLYISSVAPTLPLLVDASIRDVGGTITGAAVSNYSTGAFTANAVNAGTNPVFNWMVNGVSVQNGTSATYTNTSLSNNDVVTCVLTPDLPGCTVTTYSSNTITNTTTTPLGLDFSIQGVVDPSACTAVLEQVKWKLTTLSSNMNVVGVNGLSKFQSNNWDGGAASWNTVSNNGYFQFTATETNTSRMAGLSTTYTSSSYTTIQYAFYLVNGGSLHIYESNSDKGAFGSYTTGDVLKISVENNVVKYYRNGTLLRTSGTAPTLPLLVDVSIQNVNGTIGGAYVSNLNSGSFTANAVNAGTFPTYQWQVNGTIVQSGLSPNYTNGSLAAGDVVTCTLAPNLPGCVATTYNSNTDTYIKSGSSTTWTGITSNNWFTPSNWSSGLPDRFTSAVIPSGTPNNPTMNSDASVYDITINSGATLSMSGSPILYVYRNWTNNGTFTPATGTVDLVSCSSPAVINSASAETFYNLMINTPYGVTIASGNQQVSKTMTFVTGLVTQNATLTILNGAGVSGATDNSHVYGVVTKVGTGAFTFPVGDATQYRPIAISSPGSATDVFTAQYIRGNVGVSYPLNSKDATLATISDREYWMLNRVNGSSNVTVNLSWNTQSGSIVNMGGMHVAGWSTSSSMWKDLGNSATTGNASGGTVTSGGAVTTFSAFTLASLTTMNVLPIQLLSFTASEVNNSLVDLRWSTASEQNSNYFIVERSADGLQFDPIQTIAAAGNSHQVLNYTTKDSRPLKGISYYRLKMVDLDGTAIYSEVRVVNTGNNTELTMYPNPAINRAFIELNDNRALKVTVIDNAGRELLAIVRPTEAVLPLDVSRLAAGLYFVIIDLEDKTRVTKKLLIRR